MRRREFLAAAAVPLFLSRGHASAPFPVRYRQAPAYLAQTAFAEPGHDEFPGEKIAMEIEDRLLGALASGELPFAAACTGRSPAAAEHRPIAPDVDAAAFSEAGDPAQGWKQWRASLGTVRRARFYALPGDLIRYEVASRNAGRLEYRVGVWKQTWRDGRIVHFDPIEETVTHAERPWFTEITASAFGAAASFREQLTRGVPYWRARLDPACGLDVYGENGIAVGDIDNDGLDEIYVCQPGGLPNRLYKNDGNGRLRDISHEAGLDILDDTASALFVDLRNSGHQDLVLVRPTAIMLFLNDGAGRFKLLPDAFRFASALEGTFTSVAAADYDRDGRLDLYLCSYFYFQSEAQYRYPVPYHDARNGPPNYLFRNRLDQEPGFFEDVTASTGIDQNNDRFSFAPAWCDFDGDGWPDLYVTNDFGRKNLYKNTDGHFHDIAEAAGVDDIGPGMSAAWLDYDGDGRPDVLISNMWSAPGQRIVNDPQFGPVKQDPALLAAYRRHVKGNSLYHNNGDGTFTYTGDSQGIEMGHWSWGCDGCDFDNDGQPEIYIACGMVTNNSRTDLMSYFYRQVVSKSPVKAIAAPAYENGWNAINQMIRQDYSWDGPNPNVFYARRTGRYYDFSGVSGIDCPDDSRAFAFTDLNGDGNPDLVLKSRLAPQVRIFLNSRAAGGRIVISLRGTRSNRDAIGARVDVDGQVKWLSAGSGYLSQHSKHLHFGLGTRTLAERVRISWPSGAVQEFSHLQAGNLYEITEGSSEFRVHPLGTGAEIKAGAPAEIDNESRLMATWLREPVPLPETRRGPALLVLHAGEKLPHLQVGVQALDLRTAPADLVAGYAILRRYLFDYRADLETPFWMLLDSAGRIRRIYAGAPTDPRRDLESVDAPTPDARALPFEGVWHGQPTRDYYKIGGAMLQAGYGEQALPYLDEALRRSPENARILVAIGRVHLQANRLPQAREDLERATELDPRLPEAWNDLGGVESAAGHTEEALRLYRKALALGPDLPWALINTGRIEETLGHREEAERLYRRALAVDPRSDDAANKLGLLLAKNGQTDEARQLFEQAISIRRDDASAINNLAVLYLNTGKTKDAIAALRYGIQVAPDEDILYLNLARTWLRLGDREKARGVMQELLARKPGYAIAERALKELDTP